MKSANHEDLQILRTTSTKMSKITKQQTDCKASYTLMVQPFVFKQNYIQSSCLRRTSIVSKTLFIIPTDAHNYKIIGILIVFNIPMILQLYASVGIINSVFKTIFSLFLYQSVRIIPGIRY
jgi:hypothetical protein